MQIAMSKTRELFPLSTKKVLKKTVAGMAGWGLLFLLIYGGMVWMWLAVAEVIGGHLWWVSIVVTGLLVVIVAVKYWSQSLYYAVYFYELTGDYVVIKKGPITPLEITIPYERVQDVYVDQDILDRVFGLYDVHLSSAPVASGGAAHIDGLEKAAADGLRAMLLGRVSEKIGKKPREV